MLATKIEDAKREEGFTLIELLVVVIIIGILAAIAIPVFLNQRENARNSAVQSTLRSAATYMEIGVTENNVYPTVSGSAAAGDPVGLEDLGFRSGANVEVANPVLGANFYCIEAIHTQDGTLAAPAAADRVWALTTDPAAASAGTPVQARCAAAGGGLA